MLELLISLDLIDENSLESVADHVRDRDDISVIRCKKSGIIFLSRSDHLSVSKYQAKDAGAVSKGRSRLIEVDGEKKWMRNLDDHLRRADQFGPQVTGKNWVDFGVGEGELLQLLAEKCARAIAIEPNRQQSNALADKGFEVHRNLDPIDDGTVDIVTAFHTVEHLSDPIEILKSLHAKLKTGGIIVVEVPHARDFLIETLACEAFMEMTFWSEHLLLHTRKSLSVFLAKAGFTNVVVQGHQRHPLSNHLYWLRHGKPGGHDTWSFMNSGDMDTVYESVLDGIDQTDVLIAYAKK